MENNEELLKDIKEEFEKVHNDENIIGAENWTNAFLGALTEIGLKKYRIYSSSKSYGYEDNINVEGEWLFDLCWSREDKYKELNANIEEEKEVRKRWKKNYEGLKLICESEWDLKTEDILYDFQKLAIAKADIKLMIIQYRGIENFINIKKDIEKSIDKSLWDDGSIYILAGSGNGPDDIELQWVELNFK